VTVGTHRSYQGSQVLWEEFLSALPEEVVPPSDYLMDSVNPRSKTVVLNRFLDWMVNDRPTGLVKPHAACKMLTGLRFFFNQNHRPTDIFDSDPVALARSSVKKSDRHIRFATRKDGQPLPFNTILLSTLRASHWLSVDSTTDTMMQYIAVATGVCLGLRTGEASYTGPYVDPLHPKAKEQDHRYFMRDLLFEDSTDGSGTLIGYDELKVSSAHIQNSIDLVVFVKDSSKTSRGETDGLKHFITRGNEMETTFFNDLMTWIYRCNLPDGNHMLFSRVAYISKDPNKATYKMLLSKDYVKAMRSAATEHGINPECFTGKSARSFAVTNSSMNGDSSLRTRQITGHASEGGALAYLHPIAGSSVANRNDPESTDIPNSSRASGNTVTAFGSRDLISITALKRAASATSLVRAMGTDPNKRVNPQG